MFRNRPFLGFVLNLELFNLLPRFHVRSDAIDSCWDPECNEHGRSGVGEKGRKAGAFRQRCLQ